MGHLEAKKATERRQKSDRDTVYNSVFFSVAVWLWMGLVGRRLGLWLALVGFGWAHGVALDGL